MNINTDSSAAKYTIIYYDFDDRNFLVEHWDLSLLETINRCKMIFKDGNYKKAEILEYNPRYRIENTPIEITYES